MKILTDDDLQNIDILCGAHALRKFLIAAYTGQTISPPRVAIDLEPDALAITAGSDQKNFGFRAYSYRQELERDKEDQIVACWERETHDLTALAIGERLGAWRTGILGGLCYEALTFKNKGTCGIIGTGLQAYTQARAIAALTKPSEFIVYSKDAERRTAFAERLEADADIKTSASSDAETVVRRSDTLTVVTNSSEPVFDVGWLDQCSHVTTVGPKRVTQHETPVEIAEWADVAVSDSPQQIISQGSSHFLADTGLLATIEHLGSKFFGENEGLFRKRTLYLSAGLSGTEVALLAALTA
ncbi:MAG: hypothetical protein ABJP66_25645 [Hyphomicrobiales bacterium]